MARTNGGHILVETFIILSFVLGIHLSFIYIENLHG